MAVPVRVPRAVPLTSARTFNPPPAGIRLSPLAPRGQIILGMLSATEAAARGLVECTRCQAWHSPEDVRECTRRAFIAWADRRATAHATDPTW